MKGGKSSSLTSTVLRNQNQKKEEIKEKRKIENELYPTGAIGCLL